jgi:hypothetical protein
VAIDAAAGRVYWASADGDKISSASLSGGGGADLNTAGATVDHPIGIAVDPAARRIYWANTEDVNKVSFADLGGGGGADLPVTGATLSRPAFPALLEVPGGAGAPAITGGSTAGSVLACSQGSWAQDLLVSFLYRAPRSFAYRWSRNGGEIAGATGSSITAAAAGDYRCTVTAANEAGSGSQTSAPHAVFTPPAALLSRYTIRPRSFVAADRGPSALGGQRRRRSRPGARVSFRVNQAASVTFRVKQRRPGRRSARGRCVKPNRQNRSRRSCTRLVTLRGGFTRAGTAGSNSFRFTGRLRRRKLRPGRYLLAATPTATGRSGPTRTAGFRIKRAPRR